MLVSDIVDSTPVGRGGGRPAVDGRARRPRRAVPRAGAPPPRQRGQAPGRRLPRHLHQRPPGGARRHRRAAGHGVRTAGPTPTTTCTSASGIHTGEVVEDDGDIFGANVITAVRIADAADARRGAGVGADPRPHRGRRRPDLRRRARGDAQGPGPPRRGCTPPTGAERWWRSGRGRPAASGRRPPTARPSRALLGRRPHGGVHGGGPPRRRVAAGHPQRPAARRRHAHAHPLLAGGRARTGRRRPAGGRGRGGRGPPPPSTPASWPRPTTATPPSATRRCRAGHTGPRPFGGVGGTRQGVKCLHAHYAWLLAGGDDPVGRWVGPADAGAAGPRAAAAQSEAGPASG